MRISSRAGSVGVFLGCLAAAAATAATAAEPAACEARDLGFDRPDVAWAHAPFSKLKRDTVYTLEPRAGSPAVLRASADRSVSLYVALLKPVNAATMTLGWSWKTDAL